VSYALILRDDNVWFLTNPTLAQYAYVDSFISIPLNQWTHVVATYNGSQDPKIYINGVSVYVEHHGTTPSSLLSFTADASIGYDIDGDRWPFIGDIADVRIYNDVLSDSEIEYINNGGTSGANPGTANLVNQWLLDEGEGLTVTDSGSGSNDGTLDGATWIASDRPPSE